MSIQHLSASELERLAYITNQPELANKYAAQDEIWDMEIKHEEAVEASVSKAFEEGKREGMELDSEFQEVQNDLKFVKASHTKLFKLLDIVAKRLASDDLKTVKERRDLAKYLRHILTVTPEYPE